MKTRRDPLDRLLRAASKRAEDGLDDGPSFALEARVMVFFRRGRFEDENSVVLSVIRRGLVLACAFAASAVLVSWLEAAPATSDEISASAAMLQYFAMR